MEELFANAMRIVGDNWAIVLGLVVLLLIGSGLFQDLRMRERVLKGKLDDIKSSIQEDLTAGREQTVEQDKKDREVFQVGLYNFNESVSRAMTEIGRTQQSEFDNFGGQLRAANLVVEEQIVTVQHAMEDRMDRFTTVLNESMGQQGQLLERVADKLDQTFSHSEEQLQAIQDLLKRGVTQVRAENEQKIEHLTHKPDHRVLELCIHVSGRLEQLGNGLDELQDMGRTAAAMRDYVEALKIADAQLEIPMHTLLQRSLLTDQYRMEQAVRPQSVERVDFAIVLPQPVGVDHPIYLPVDTKFPVEESLRLMQALEYMDPDETEAAAKEMELALRVQAKRMREAFVDPPFTTDYAILYLPSEGMYAQMLQNNVLREQLQTQYHVLLAGPATMGALLLSLQAGMRTDAMERRTRELRGVLSEASGGMTSLHDMLTAATAEPDAKTLEDTAPKPVLQPSPAPKAHVKSLQTAAIHALRPEPVPEAPAMQSVAQEDTLDGMADQDREPMSEAQRLLEIERKRFQALYGHKNMNLDPSFSLPIELDCVKAFEEEYQEPIEDDDWD